MVRGESHPNCFLSVILFLRNVGLEMLSGLYSYFFVGGVCIYWVWGTERCFIKYIDSSLRNSLSKQHKRCSSYHIARWLFFERAFKSGCAIAPCSMLETVCIKLRKMIRILICRRKVRLLLPPLLPYYPNITITADIRLLQRSITARFVKSKKKSSTYWIWSRRWEGSLTPI